ncbi:MAG: S8 family serine peptidase [Candidatus Eisenbacteria bacterium]
MQSRGFFAPRHIVILFVCCILLAFFIGTQSSGGEAASPFLSAVPTTEFSGGFRDLPDVTPFQRALRAAPDSLVTVWVFLADKGPLPETERAISEIDRRFCRRALARRARAGREHLVDWRDVPVWPPYIAAIRGRGFELRAVSKWLNAVSVRGRARDASSLSQLPFIAGLRPVASFPRREIDFEEMPEPIENRGLPLQRRSDAAAAVEQPANLSTQDTESDGTLRLPAPRGLVQSFAPGDPSFYGATWRQLDMIQVPTLHAQGFTGEGMFIGVLDTGFYLEHQALKNVNVVAQWDFINWDSVTANEPGQDSLPQHNHGTLIMGIIGGCLPGVYSGAAFGADFALAKTEVYTSETPVEEDYWVMGIEWLDSLGVDLVTSSLGYIDWYTYENMDGNTAVTTIAADIAVENGVSVFSAMGNGGLTLYPYAIAPADGDSVMSIGAVDSLGALWPQSSRGPTYDGRIKPEIVAQGQYVYCVSPIDTLAYGRASGTSCATPLAAGACALLLQKNPQWNPIMLREAVRATGTGSTSPDTATGWGILQADDASNWQLVAVSEGASAQNWGSALRVSSAPNPFNPVTYISIRFLRHESKRPPTARIFDVTGRCVKDFGTLRPAGGEVNLTWDGRDTLGRQLSSGVYVLIVDADTELQARKLLLLR